MAAIAAANVTTTVLHQDRTERGRRFNCVSIAFGNGTLTYPTGGIPLSAGNMGLPNVILDLLLSDASNPDGYQYKWNAATNSIRIYQGGASTSVPGIELTTGAAPAATTLQARAIGW